MHEESAIGVIVTLLSGIISISVSAHIYRTRKNKPLAFLLGSLLFLNLIWYATLTFYYLREFFPMPGDPLRIYWFEFIMFSLLYTFRFGLLVSLLMLIKHLLMQTVPRRIITIIRNAILFLTMFWFISWIEVPLLGSSGMVDQLMVLTDLIIFVSVIVAAVYLRYRSGYLYSDELKDAVNYLTIIIIVPFAVGSLKLVVGSAITKISPLLERSMIYFFITLYNLLAMLWIVKYSKSIAGFKFGGINTKTKSFDAFAAEYKISKREREVIRLICEGKSNKEIAGQLFISIETVKDHNYKIYQKVGVKSRMQLVNLVHNYGTNV